jgi:hypothetical protein
MANKVSSKEAMVQGWKVMGAMLQKTNFRSGIIKYTIPDEIFDGSTKVKVDGLAVNIYHIPGQKNGGPNNVIEYAIEAFNKAYGAPVWSQIVSAPTQIYGKLVQYPKTVYLKRVV